MGSSRTGSNPVRSDKSGNIFFFFFSSEKVCFLVLLTFFVFILDWTLPFFALVRFLLCPLLFKHEPEVLVAEGGLGATPRAPETAAVSVTPTNCMSS